MLEFLSPEWVAALDRAARRSVPRHAGTTAAPLVIEQRVAMPDGSERAHHLVLTDDGARFELGRAATPDVVVHADLAAARALALGEVNAQHALAHGQLRLSGSVETLLERAEALRALDDIFGSVRAETTYPLIDGSPLEGPSSDAATVTSAE